MVINFSSLCIYHRESTLCSSLGGRTSDYITPPNLPPEIQLNIASVGYSDLTLRLLLEQTESPEACYEFAIHQLCLVVAPPCNPNTFAPLLLCPETCLAYDRLISSRLCDSYGDEIIQTLEKSSLDSLRALANRFRVFNCSDPATYFQNRTAEFENSSCTNLFSPNTQGAELYYKLPNLHVAIYIMTKPDYTFVMHWTASAAMVLWFVFLQSQSWAWNHFSGWQLIMHILV